MEETITTSHGHSPPPAVKTTGLYSYCKTTVL